MTVVRITTGTASDPLELSLAAYDQYIRIMHHFNRGVFVALLWAAAAWPSMAGSTELSDPVERERFRYYFDNPRYIETADLILNRTRTRLAKWLRDTLTYKPDIYLVGDMTEFNRLVGGRFPEWGAAAAITHKGRIVIKSPDRFNLNRRLEELLAHEYSHLALAHRTGIKSAPRWFDEGLAMMTSMEWNWSDNLAMSRAAVFGQLIPLVEIDNVNRFGEGKAHVAYSESYLAVFYLYDAYGTDAVNILLDQIAAGRSLDKALISSTGSNYADFQKEFRLYLLSRFNVTSLFMDTMWFWLALAMIVLIGVFLRYRKRRQYYRRWEEEERLHSTDFDYGDTDHPERVNDEDEPWRP